MSTTLAAMMEAFFILGLLCEQEIQLLSQILGNVTMTKGIPVRQQKPVSLAMMLSARPRNGRTKLPELSQDSEAWYALTRSPESRACLKPAIASVNVREGRVGRTGRRAADH